MKSSEMRAKSEKELAKMLEEKQAALFGLRLQRATGQLSKNAQLKMARREIARMETLLREKRVEGKEKREEGKSR